jgi:hypothetical protein
VVSPLEAALKVSAADVVDLADDLAGRKRNRDVVTPHTGGLVVQAITDHARERKHTVPLELKRDPERFANGPTSDAVAQSRLHHWYAHTIPSD